MKTPGTGRQQAAQTINDAHPPTQSDLCHEFGGDGPAIHLAPATGFPPGSYRLLAGTLLERHRVLALLSRPLWPGSEPKDTPTWHPMAGDLVQGLDRLGLSSIVGVGHSLGGVLTLWAAIQRPDLFRAVILIDPVILPATYLWLMRIVRGLGLAHRQPLVQGALRRRRIWPSAQACYEYFRSKSFFATWPDAAIHDYVDFGTRQRGDGQVELAFPPEWEAHIFATTPTTIWRDLPNLRTPALIIRGEHSHTFLRVAQARMAHLLPQAHFITMPDAGHMVPMEKAEDTGRAILTFLDHLPLRFAGEE
ncbi:MAG: alpha/beta fold hydrolase [Anaerolineae bacterium]